MQQRINTLCDEKSALTPFVTLFAFLNYVHVKISHDTE